MPGGVAVACGVAAVSAPPLIAADLWRTYARFKRVPVPEVSLAYPPGPGFEGVGNVRDVGGYAGAGGKRVRRGLLLRTAKLTRLTKSDQRRLAPFRLIADFRSDSEVRKEPDRLGGDLQQRWQHFDASDGGDFLKFVFEVIAGPRAECKQRLENFLLQANRDFALKHRQVFASFLRGLATGEATPALVHCTAGKDRTGWAVALLLRVLGVAEETILEEYLLSNAGFEASAVKYMLAIRVLSCWRLGPDEVEGVLHVRPEYLRAGFQAVVEAYGTWDAYFRDGLGLSDQTLEALRDHFLEEAVAARL